MSTRATGLTPLEQAFAEGIATRLWEHGDSAMGALCTEHEHRIVPPKECRACLGIAAAETIRDAVRKGEVTAATLGLETTQ